ncbi:MAG: hypothetical protein LUC29_09540 [Acidaminococcaceae bacterium]|nr:hypothetical protein [Acidaminococcaceae bacterium]
MTEEKELQPVDIEWEAEKICRWGAARAGVIVVAPLVGTMALMANEVYMIMRLGELRGVKLEESTVLGLLTSLGATFVGQTLVTLIPIAPIQVPVGVSVTYAVGKAANAWIKAGRSEDVAAFREVYESARKEGLKHSEDFEKMDCKDTPLGDESKRFDLQELKEVLRSKSGHLFTAIEKHADRAETVLAEKLATVSEKLRPLKDKGQLWFSAQNWEQLGQGELVVPYDEIVAYVHKSLTGSEFALQSLAYAEPDLLRLVVKHKTHGTLELLLRVEVFNVDAGAAFTRLKLVDFSVADNDFAQLVVELMGSKLILAIVDLLIDRVDIDTDSITTKYEQGEISVDFTAALQQSKMQQKKVLDRSLFDVVHLVALVPQSEGVLVKAKTEWK